MEGPNVDDRELASARAELMVLKIVVDRTLAALRNVDGDMLTSAPPVVRDESASGSPSAARWAPANPTLDIVTHPARSGLSEALTAVRHLARGAAGHLNHHTEKLRQHTVAWLGESEETE